MSPAKQPELGVGRPVYLGPGHDDRSQALRDSGGFGTQGLCQPRLHLALPRNPENPLFVRLPSGLLEEKHFHLTASTRLFISLQQGKERRATSPSTLEGTHWSAKEVKGQGSPRKSFPTPITWGNRQHLITEQAPWGNHMPSLIHSFHTSLHAKHLQIVRVKKEARHGSSLYAAPNPMGENWESPPSGHRVRSLRMEIGPAKAFWLLTALLEGGQL